MDDPFIKIYCFMPVGIQNIQIVPGNQTTFDLRDLIVGVSYDVSVTPLVGDNEGEPTSVFVRPGESCCHTFFFLPS